MHDRSATMADRFILTVIDNPQPMFIMGVSISDSIIGEEGYMFSQMIKHE